MRTAAFRYSSLAAMPLSWLLAGVALTLEGFPKKCFLLFVRLVL